MRNNNLILFVGVGFIVTTIIWGLVGGCGTTRQYDVKDEETKRTQSIDTKKPEKNQNKDIELEGVEEYIVEPGDSLWGISKRYGIPIAEIKKASSLDGDNIYVGQKLMIPGGEKKESMDIVEKKQIEKSSPIEESNRNPKIDKSISYENKNISGDLIVYRVRKGDSLWRIAQIHGVSIERIIKLNGISRKAKLKPGEELLVPKNE